MTPPADADLPTWGRDKQGHVNGRVNGRVNGWLTEAPGGATWSLRERTAAGRAAAEVGACAWPDAPPSRRGLVAGSDSDDGIARGEPSAGGAASVCRI